MKFVGFQLAHYLNDQKVKNNVNTLLKYLAFLVTVVIIYAVVFRYIMIYVEGESHSWVTGFYWTLTVMSTLGFGDITFESDIGRIFSMIVLLSGIVLLLIVLPFAFIRHFYAPFLESRLLRKTPKQVPSYTKDHIIFCSYDSIAQVLIRKLDNENIPYYILEDDPATAATRYQDGLPVVFVSPDEEENFHSLNLDTCRMVLVNREDTENTKFILGIHDVEPNVPIIALANEDDSVDILQLSGANHVLPIKRWLGEQLANRVSSIRPVTYPVGKYKDLVIAEFPVHHTSLAGKTVRESALRQTAGVSVIGMWERGRLQPVHADTLLTNANILVLIGKERQLSAFDTMIDSDDMVDAPVVIIGGGRVGMAAIESMSKRDIAVNLVERDKKLCKKLSPVCNGVYNGDAADYDLLIEAGIKEAPSVLLTTNDDSMNIFLASYCRQLNQDIRIVSRITSERNIEIIHKAGADFVLSYASLGAEAIYSIMKGQELIVLSERVKMFLLATPPSLFGKTLVESEIGAKSGLTVIAIQRGDEVTTTIDGGTVIEPETSLLLLGDSEQRKVFERLYV